MQFFILLISLAIISSTIASCATAPDPAKVCTSEWISKRSDKAISRIESKSKRSLNSLQKAGKSWSKGKTPNPFQMLMLSNSLKSLENELKDGQGIRDLKMLSATCNDPTIISDAMGGFLRKQGLPDNIINFIEGMGIYQDLLKPNPSLPNRV